ncbi:AraC family transcriptional regulator [Actinomycetospora endophytica]|uniref:AraC family transcriptional regulator n=1 Tax=Actinomycetospora endophytica TaxID=2291215 RepID=A0ABS8P811_9PSEU|nr:AraC family transcriptional regulator [Actinomycetospora endophytica]MCD2193179.1 AraC family transcriptional regulator [Actinomycetospora endophytica]
MFLLAGVPPPLRGVVRRLAAYDEHSPTPVRRRQAPGSTCTLVLGLGEPLRVDDRELGSFLGGLADAAALTEFRGHQAGVQVDLAPLGLLRLLGAPGQELSRAPLSPTELAEVSPAGRVLAGLPDRVADLGAWPQRLALVTDTLTALLAGSTAAPDPEVAHAWRRLTAAGGRIPVPDLAAEVGWSRRHLSRRFTSQVGLAPTTTARVLRFRRAADLLVPAPGAVAGPPRRIADVALDCGYADHAHLDREFRALAGATPQDYVSGWAAAGVDPAEVVHG